MLDGRLVAGDHRRRRVAAHRRVRRRPQAARRRGVQRQLRDDRRRALRGGDGRADSFANRITAGARSFRRVITPLQAQINLVIRVVLGIVIYLEILLVLRGVVQRAVLGDVVADATLLAGLVPNGLFVSIAVAYALGAIRILRFGALVQQANAIESLSHVDVLCLDKTGTLTANRLEVEAVDRPRRRLRGRGRSPCWRRSPASATVAQPDHRGDRRPLARRAAAPGGRGAVLVGAQVERGRVRRTRTRRCRGSSRSARRRSCGPPWRRATTASPPAGRRSRRPRPRWTERGLRVLLVATHADAAALPPARRRGRRDAARGHARPRAGRARATSCAPRPARVLASFAAAGRQRQDHLGRRPGHRRRRSPARRASADAAVHRGPRAGRPRRGRRSARSRRRTRSSGGSRRPRRSGSSTRCKARGHYVAMIGDGVNDVLSLKKANLAIAMGSGSQATRGVADLVLMEDSFAAVAAGGPGGPADPQRDAGHPEAVPDPDRDGRPRDRQQPRRRHVPDRAAQRVRPDGVHGGHPERPARAVGAPGPPGARQPRTGRSRGSSCPPPSCRASSGCSCSTASLALSSPDADGARAGAPATPGPRSPRSSCSWGCS